MPYATEMLYLSPDSWSIAFEEQQRWESSHLEELKSELKGFPHDVQLPKGKVSNELARIVEEEKIDLLVLGTRGRTGLHKVVLGSVAEEVFRAAKCPVLTVGPNFCCKPASEVHFEHILFATDLSEDSLSALPYAISLAEEDQARITLLYVVHQPLAGVPHPEQLKASLMSQLRDLIPREAEPWCEAECRVEFSQQFGPPGEKILQVAAEQCADLIVLGVRKMHGPGIAVTHLTPTTAQYTVAHAQLPVLTVRG
jgi:nucleotide-binding universal stress UspA family protein